MCTENLENTRDFATYVSGVRWEETRQVWLDLLLLLGASYTLLFRLLVAVEDCSQGAELFKARWSREFTSCHAVERACCMYVHCMRASMQFFYPLLEYKFGTVCLDLLRSLLLVYSSVYLISSLLGGHVLMPLFECWHQPRRRATSSSFYCALCRTTKNVSSYVTKQSVRARLWIILK